MEQREFTHLADGEELSCTTFTPAGGERPERVVIMHGAGAGSKQRSLPLAREFADAGFRSLAFDFSGHGQSTGELTGLSLERRFLQARSVATEFAPDAPLILVGFSMSGQTVADLVGELGERVSTIVLGAPAAYAPEAWKLPFGAAGFTEILRTPGSWETSPAFDAYRGFTGRAVLIVPDHDAVIPPEVTSRIDAALREHSRLARITFPGSEHMIGHWLSEHPADRRRVVGLCL
ncbi:alpha/beta fold hydrolase [Kitasatospora sp. MAP5-34]|uniref:alpha/beta hydrolase n=1 Tax=Kitasatospora sp. MAP5-34 TaxID=3035102 RepID=UPI00247430F7|nr:alpha/beta fold hydrolase [Kitasatospora sp. MAP5-34]MDH6578745.1 pimeloyl-ACP methyl ester carboxylesterase [Kitasatospora sp. MAP5-34]